MFKIGDKVVCIDGCNREYFGMYPEKYKKYIITSVDDRLLTINTSSIRYTKSRFISLTEYRKQKINKILSKIN